MRPFLLFLSAMILGLSGFFAGRFLDFDGEPLPEQRTFSALPARDMPYLVATASSGPMLRTVPVRITVEENGKAHTLLEAVHADSVQTGQQVMLYGESGDVLPDTGQVVNIAPFPADNTVQITISLPEDYPIHPIAGEDETEARAAIITLYVSLAKRLPRSARQEEAEDKGSPGFVWKAVLDPEGNASSYKAVRIPLSVWFAGDSYFQAGPEIRSDDLVILSPDEKLRDMQEVRVEKTVLDAPLRTPVEQAAEERVSRFFEDMEKQLEDSITDSGENQSCQTPADGRCVPCQ